MYRFITGIDARREVVVRVYVDVDGLAAVFVVVVVVVAFDREQGKINNVEYVGPRLQYVDNVDAKHLSAILCCNLTLSLNLKLKLKSNFLDIFFETFKTINIQNILSIARYKHLCLSLYLLVPSSEVRLLSVCCVNSVYQNEVIKCFDNFYFILNDVNFLPPYSLRLQGDTHCK